MRVDFSETLFGVRTNVWTAVLAVILGLVLIAIQNRRHPGQELSVYVSGVTTVNSNETAMDSAEKGKEAST